MAQGRGGWQGLRTVRDHGYILLLLLVLWTFQFGNAWALRGMGPTPLAGAAVAREWAPLLVAMVILAPLILFAARRCPLQAGRAGRSLAGHALALLLVAALAHLLERAIYLLMDPGFAAHPSGRLRPGFVSDGWDGFLGVLCGVAPYYLLVATAYHALNFKEAHQERALKAALMEAEHAQVRLQTLKSQLHPHFLFNALNALYGHIPPEAEPAQRMVVLLSEFLRRSLGEFNAQVVTLGQELDFARLYLDIQSLRFPGLLEVTWTVEDALLGLETPHLILQPLVENAVKHGFAQRAEPGRIWIQARRNLGCLELDVLDDGPGPHRSTQPGTGTGLTNIRKRLHYLYGDLGHLECGERPGGGFCARVRIPLKEVRS